MNLQELVDLRDKISELIDENVLAHWETDDDEFVIVGPDDLMREAASNGYIVTFKVTTVKVDPTSLVTFGNGESMLKRPPKKAKAATTERKRDQRKATRVIATTDATTDATTTAPTAGRKPRSTASVLPI